MFDAIGIIFVGVALAVFVAAIVTVMPLGISGRLVLAAAVGAWVGFVGAVAGSGGLPNPLAVLAMFATPLIVAAVIVRSVPGVRTALSTVPVSVLIGLNALRLGGVLFVLLALNGRLSGPFPYSAGWGDFITGALAIPVAWLSQSEARFKDRLIMAWNTFGVLDLIVAVALGVMSVNGSPLQLIHAAVGTAAMQALPWAFVPTVLVPLFLIDHAIIFARLRARPLGKSDLRPISAAMVGQAS